MRRGRNRGDPFGIAGRGGSLWSFGVSGSNDKIESEVLKPRTRLSMYSQVVRQRTMRNS
jgi:hypothetical protein